MKKFIASILCMAITCFSFTASAATLDNPVVSANSYLAASQISVNVADINEAFVTHNQMSKPNLASLSEGESAQTEGKIVLLLVIGAAYCTQLSYTRWGGGSTFTATWNCHGRYQP